MTSTNPGVWLKRGFFTLRKHSARRKVLIQSPRLRDSGATFYLRVVAPATVTQKF